MNAYLDEWLAGVRPTLESAAYTNYRSLLDLYVRPRIGGKQLSAVSASTLTALYGGLLAEGGKCGKPLSPTTVRLVHRVMSKALGDAVETRLLVANPATHAKAPKRRRKEMRTWTAAQAAEFLKYTADDRLYACWLLALTCGMRRGADLFQRLAKAAGVPVIRLHDARHSCATLGLDAGIHPKVVQQLLGHASWSTTMDLYSHRVAHLQREATGRIESALFAGVDADAGESHADERS